MSILKTLEYEQDVERALRRLEEDIWGSDRVQQLIQQLQLADHQAEIQKQMLQSMGVPSTILFPGLEHPADEAKRVLEDAQREVERLEFLKRRMESAKKPCEEAPAPSFVFRRKLEP